MPLCCSCLRAWLLASTSAATGASSVCCNVVHCARTSCRAISRHLSPSVAISISPSLSAAWEFKTMAFDEAEELSSLMLPTKIQWPLRYWAVATAMADGTERAQVPMQSEARIQSFRLARKRCHGTCSQASRSPGARPVPRWTGLGHVQREGVLGTDGQMFYTQLTAFCYSCMLQCTGSRKACLTLPEGPYPEGPYLKVLTLKVLT